MIFQLCDGRDDRLDGCTPRAAAGALDPARSGRMQREVWGAGWTSSRQQLAAMGGIERGRGREHTIRTLRGLPGIAIRYEDLRADTMGTLRPLVDWLGCERSDEELEAAVAAHAFEAYPTRAKGPTKPLRAASPGLWRENMSDAEQQEMNEVMGETLERLGYVV